MLLPTSAMGLLLAALPLLAPAAAAAGPPTCQPGQDCWPTLDQWQAFNKTVSGRLRVSQPMGSACFPSSPNYDPAACDTIRAKFGDSDFRMSFDTTLQTIQYEACGTQNCYPGTAFPQGETCSLGRFSPLYVEVESAEDVSKTLLFSQQYGIRNVIYNSGHDYLGRNSAPNTLAIFTRRLKNMSFDASFTPTNCPAAGTLENVGTIGAGVNAEDVVPFFVQHGMMINTGACSTVGIAGGYSMGGGHGPLTPKFGMFVDQAVEMDVVTADGQIRTINECNDPDLFWAMRGGGGSTFAVLVNYKLRVHPSNKFATWLFEAVVSEDPNEPDLTKNDALRGALTTMAQNSPNWVRNFMSGYIIYANPLFVLMQILPDGEDPLAAIEQITASANASLSSNPGLSIVTNEYTEYPSQAEFLFDTKPIFDQFSPVAIGVSNPSRLVTDDMFQSADKLNETVSAILGGLEQSRLALGGDLGESVVFGALQTGALNTADDKGATSINPAWRETIWHALMISVWPPGAPADVVDKVTKAGAAGLAEMKKPLSVQAAYFNEADAAEQDWQDVFWGGNYDRLLAIKNQYDPDHIFKCRKCVGWESDEEDPMFSCFTDKPVASVSFPFA
ncbi:6-hydroxy-D-nicotine oxidase [Escovopsis weberi]|uniref:6-hydroxy-D-nicotine oxidase n=1 Tax=Escovopsis weberi TaxID=150374 RepID=A0A0M8MVZ6_ESCWE|nr:6-hydroxy-D-nicotine oxidase [Escovopsis weberi]